MDPNTTIRRDTYALPHWFQFPSNGKVDPNTPDEVFDPTNRHQSFNSLQTGKWILTELPREVMKRGWFQFQFPSNGKVDPNSESLTGHSGLIRFNSLQTGKWILTSVCLRVVPGF